MMTLDEENGLLDEFVRDNIEEFLEYIVGYDRTLFDDFAETVRWKWNKFKEDNTSDIV